MLKIPERGTRLKGDHGVTGAMFGEALQKGEKSWVIKTSSVLVEWALDSRILGTALEKPCSPPNMQVDYPFLTTNPVNQNERKKGKTNRFKGASYI
ncbi:MAG: hypothetical protein JNN12_01275 [Bacteroidetes Order II. Incertae sedis bacterium]|nr:hypothetical protein [Bacteroidetes Order II. bacterium]